MQSMQRLQKRSPIQEQNVNNNIKKRKRMRKGLHEARKFRVLTYPPVPVILKYPYSRNHCIANNSQCAYCGKPEEDFNRFAYPGVNFGRTKPFSSCNCSECDENSEDFKNRTMICNERNKDVSRSSQGRTVYTCNCMKERSESFYDIFLASSVRESPEYEEYVERRRKNRQKKTSTGVNKKRVEEDDDDVHDVCKIRYLF